MRAGGEMGVYCLHGSLTWGYRCQVMITSPVHNKLLGENSHDKSVIQLTHPRVPLNMEVSPAAGGGGGGGGGD